MYNNYIIRKLYCKVSKNNEFINKINEMQRFLLRKARRPILPLDKMKEKVHNYFLVKELYPK